VTRNAFRKLTSPSDTLLVRLIEEIAWKKDLSGRRVPEKKFFWPSFCASEESLRIQNKNPREIFAQSRRFRMTPFRLFPQTVQTLPARRIIETLQIMQTSGRGPPDSY